MKNTKKSLLVSVLSLVLCFAMLLGTTYAWFTDSVQSGKNTITAGNLDIELLHTNANVTDAAVKDSTDLFLAKDGTAIKWEPGVIAYENFTVENLGDLALKYAFTLNVHNCNNLNGKCLTDVIKVAVVDGGFKGTTRADIPAGTEFGDLTGFIKNGNLAVSGDNSKNTYGVVLYWEPTDHDNDYNVNNGQKTDDNGNALFIEFGVNLVATQDTVEADSFGTDYDKTAPLAVSFTPMTKKLADNETLRIETTAEEQGLDMEATVPAAVANAVFDKAFEGSETTTDKSLTLVLNVEKKGETTTETETGTSTEINYAIDMDAVIKELTNGTVTKNETKSIDELNLTFEDWVEVQLKIDEGLQNVAVKHNGNAMTETESKDAIPSTDQNPAGYFNYADSTGALKLWIKDFSPFDVTGEILKPYVFTTVRKNGELLNEQFVDGHNLTAGLAENTFANSKIKGIDNPKLFGISESCADQTFTINYGKDYGYEKVKEYLTEKLGPAPTDLNVSLKVYADKEVDACYSFMYDAGGINGWSDISGVERKTLNDSGLELCKFNYRCKDGAITELAKSPAGKTFEKKEYFGKEMVFFFGADCNENITLTFKIVAEGGGKTCELASYSVIYAPHTYTPAN